MVRLVEQRSSSNGQDASRATAQATLRYYLRERIQLCVRYLRSRLVQRNFSEGVFSIYENLLAFVTPEPTGSTMRPGQILLFSILKPAITIMQTVSQR